MYYLWSVQNITKTYLMHQLDLCVQKIVKGNLLNLLTLYFRNMDLKDNILKEPHGNIAFLCLMTLMDYQHYMVAKKY